MRRALRLLGTVVAVALVWFAVAGPDTVAELSVRGLVVLPLDGVLLLALIGWAGSRRATGPAAAVLTVVGVFLGVVSLLRVLDLGFGWALDRPFDPLSDWSYVGAARGLLAVISRRHVRIFGLVGAFQRPVRALLRGGVAIVGHCYSPSASRR